MCGFIGVCAAEGEGVVAVGFGGVVEGAVYIMYVRNIILSSFIFIFGYKYVRNVFIST